MLSFHYMHYGWPPLWLNLISVCDGCCIALKAIKAASEAEPDVSHLSGMASKILEGNLFQFSCLYMSIA